MNFKQFIMEQVPNNITRVAVFDVDDTLIFSPTPEKGMSLYTQKTGIPWEIKDSETAKKHGFDPKFRRRSWWSSLDSMKPPVFEPAPEHLNKAVADIFHAFKKDPSTYVVVMTGRPSFFEKHIKNILNQYGIFADAYFFQGQADIRKEPGYPKKQDTFEYKAFVISHKLMTPNVEVLEIFDDREEHIPKFVQLGKKLKGEWPNLKEVIVHDVKTGQSFK